MRARPDQAGRTDIWDCRSRGGCHVLRRLFPSCPRAITGPDDVLDIEIDTEMPEFKTQIQRDRWRHVQQLWMQLIAAT
jgi:hypothetical protein